MAKTQERVGRVQSRRAQYNLVQWDGAGSAGIKIILSPRITLTHSSPLCTFSSKTAAVTGGEGCAVPPPTLSAPIKRDARKSLRLQS